MSQNAFIKKRYIHDNFLYAQNVISALHKSKPPSIFIKLDISRAFDLVSWPFLERFTRVPRLRRWCWFKWKSSNRPWANTWRSIVIKETKNYSLLPWLLKQALIGNKGLFWHSNWLSGQAPKILTPNIFNKSIQKKVTVQKTLRNNAWVSHLHGWFQGRTERVVMLILATHLPIFFKKAGTVRVRGRWAPQNNTMPYTRKVAS